MRLPSGVSCFILLSMFTRNIGWPSLERVEPYSGYPRALEATVLDASLQVACPLPQPRDRPCSGIRLLMRLGTGWAGVGSS